MDFLIFVAVIGIMIWNIRLSERIKDLEKGDRKSMPEEVPYNEPVYENKIIEGPPLQENGLPYAEEVSEPEYIAPPEKPFSFEDFLGRKFFSILGSVSIVLALVFFASWAFANGYIGPKGQVAIGIVVSLVFLVMGELFRNKYPKFFPVLSSVGIAGLLAITFVASNVYGFLSSNQSFIAYIIEISAGILLSLRYDSRILGNFSIIGGLLAPVLIQSPEPNAIGLFTFLSLLSVAGFLVSTQKKWSEILAVLFIGITLFEVQILNMKLLSDKPIVFLSFLFGMHYLLGSGGLIRCIKEKAVQKISQLSSSDILDTLIFIFSVLAANIIAYVIFGENLWENFGFFALAQGFLLFWYAEIAKKHDFEIFQKLFLGATLAVIVFATGWEIGMNRYFAVTMAFLLEGVLFHVAARKTRDSVFQVFGCIALGLAFSRIFEISSVAESGFLSLGLLGALVFSLFKEVRNGFDKVWPIIAFVLGSITVLYWNFETLNDILLRENTFLVFIIPVIFGCSVAYSVIKTQNHLSRLLGMIFLGIINLFLFTHLANVASLSIPAFKPLLALLIVLIGNFTAWTTYFISHDKNIVYSPYKQTIATIVTLSFSSIGMLFWGIGINEPMRSISWVIWTILLILVGIKNSWDWFRYFGIGTFCIIIGKWYLSDIWRLPTWIKFVAFGALGLGLLFISFWYQKKTTK